MFETSGGMYFADSKKSKQLLKYWIDTQKPGMMVKQMISLTFNVRKLSLDITSIQLPIGLPSIIHQKSCSWDFGMVRKVLIEHPECQSRKIQQLENHDRQPKYYDFIEV